MPARHLFEGNDLFYVAVPGTLTLLRNGRKLKETVESKISDCRSKFPQENAGITIGLSGAKQKMRGSISG